MLSGEGWVVKAPLADKWVTVDYGLRANDRFPLYTAREDL